MQTNDWKCGKGMASSHGLNVCNELELSELGVLKIFPSQHPAQQTFSITTRLPLNCWNFWRTSPFKNTESPLMLVMILAFVDPILHFYGSYKIVRISSLSEIFCWMFLNVLLAALMFWTTDNHFLYRYWLYVCKMTNKGAVV